MRKGMNESEAGMCGLREGQTMNDLLHIGPSNVCISSVLL